MNTKILHKDVQDFINEHLKTDLTKLIFKGSPFDGITIQELAAQIEVKKRCEKKLPTWFETENIYYPNKLNIEQSSSGATANYKSGLLSGNSIIDITGGFGVDAFYFSKRFKEVTHCELNYELSQIAAHNFKQLNASIHTISQDGLGYLKSQNPHYDWIYVDPSRRNEAKGKVFLLSDCLPNIPEVLSFLFEHSDAILIKASPILDISNAVNELNFVSEVHIVALDNEVKELLFILHKGYTDSIQVKTANIKTNTTEYFNRALNANVKPDFSVPLSYLYEPNAAILKAGFFNEVSSQLNVFKLHKNSHLYTSNKLIEFPGRRFIIKHQLSYDKKSLKRFIPSKKANFTTRNFPEKVAQIRKKTGIKEGGNDYVFFTTDLNNKRIVLICEKV
ncbi:MAG: class I SAM-dependent methyltransferase [Flavobacteriaceae bacterium]|nr:class I SAM-dependent methyltransferase [Flavobacteriaceae bacterium]